MECLSHQHQRLGRRSVTDGSSQRWRSAVWAFDAGSEVDLALGTHVTFHPHYNSVSLHSSVTPDAGNNRMVVLCVRTNDR